MSIPVPVEMQGPRVRLRRHTASDAAAFVAFMTDASATRFMAFTDEQKTEAGAAAMLDFVISAYGTENEVCSLTIAARGSDEYLGAVGAAPRDDPGEVEVFFTVVPAHQGRGLAGEATGLLLNHLSASRAFERAVARVVEANIASVRVLQRLGFRRRGQTDRAAAGGVAGHAAMSGALYWKELRPSQ